MSHFSKLQTKKETEGKEVRIRRRGSNNSSKRQERTKQDGTFEEAEGEEERRSRPSKGLSIDRTTDEWSSVQKKGSTGQPFLDATLKKGVEGVCKEFAEMKRSNNMSVMTAFRAYPDLNRYKDVVCLDNARVILSIGTNPYIHANYVDTIGNPKRFICTQAPTDKTIIDFWTMVIQERSVAVIMLCDFEEQNKPKCAHYYSTDPGAEMKFGGGDFQVTVKCLKHTKIQFKQKTKTTMMYTRLKVTGYKQSLTVRHIHWQHWPDRGVPNVDLAAIELLGRIKKWESKEKSKAPVVIHCSAGVGRTGSIVLLEMAMSALQGKQQLMDMSTYLLEIRKQRNNSIQTELQYLWAHMTLLNYLEKYHHIPDDRLSALQKFKKDFEAKRNSSGQ